MTNNNPINFNTDRVSVTYAVEMVLGTKVLKDNGTKMPEKVDQEEGIVPSFVSHYVTVRNSLVLVFYDDPAIAITVAKIPRRSTPNANN